MQTPRSKRGIFFRFMAVLRFVAPLAFAGCGESTETISKSTPNFSGISLKIGALGDPKILAGAKLQQGEWVASRAGSLEFGEKAISMSDLSGVDVVLFPGDQMGDLVDARGLAVIPRDAVMVVRSIDDTDPASPARDEEEPKEPSGPVESFQYADIAPVFRDQVAKYGKELVALPYGGSALVLAYRQDAFRREANQGAAREAGISRLEPPKTWKDFEALARFFQKRDWDGDGSPNYGVSLALGEDTDGVANSIFLARAASPGKHDHFFTFLFDDDTMNSRLDSPPFVEALSSLVSLRGCGPPGIEGFDAQAAREAFRAGRTAMLIDRAECASKWSHGKPIGVAPLPGSGRVYNPERKTWEDVSPPNTATYLPLGGGWLIGVRRGLEGKKLEAAIDFARFLADPENSNRVRTDRSFAMLPFRISQMEQGMPDPTAAADVDFRSWSDSVSRTLMADEKRVVIGLRIPEADGYLADLSRGRQAALKGESVEKALENVAKDWAKRTAALGPRYQTWHYRRSLNLSTTSEPPPKGQ